MASTVGEIYDQIMLESGRGHSIEGLLPAQCQRAVNWLERNRNFSYMVDWNYFFANPFADDPMEVTLAVSEANEDVLGHRIKSVKSLGWLEPSQMAYYELQKVSFQDTFTGSAGVPLRYRSYDEKVYFHTLPDKQYMGRALVYRMSIWPTDDLEATHPLIKLGEDFLVHHVLFNLSPYLRNPALMSMYKTLRDDDLATLNLTQDEEDWETSVVATYLGSNPSLFEPTITEPRLSQVPAAAVALIPDADELVP